MSNYKICPFTFRKEQVKAVMVGHGDFERVRVEECLYEKCMAYKDGKCMRLENNV